MTEASASPPSSREKILDVAEALFARRGYAGVGLREVAEEAGLGKSSLFHHFRSKAEIYLAVLARVLERVNERVAPILASGGSHLERLDRVLDSLIDSLAEHPTTARLLLRSLFEDDDLPDTDDVKRAAEEIDRSLAAILDRMLRLLRDGIEAGSFRPASARHTLQTLIGATVYHFASGELGEALFGRPVFSAETVRRRKEEIKNLVHSGLAAAPVAAPAGGRP